MVPQIHVPAPPGMGRMRRGQGRGLKAVTMNTSCILEQIRTHAAGGREGPTSSTALVVIVDLVPLVFAGIRRPARQPLRNPGPLRAQFTVDSPQSVILLRAQKVRISQS